MNGGILKKWFQPFGEAALQHAPPFGVPSEEVSRAPLAVTGFGSPSSGPCGR